MLILCELVVNENVVGAPVVVMANHDFGEHLVQIKVGEAEIVLTLGLIQLNHFGVKYLIVIVEGAMVFALPRTIVLIFGANLKHLDVANLDKLGAHVPAHIND